MGQGQSSSSGPQADEVIKTSYYELLGIERTATEEEVKKAYRRKALELHPDRNYGREEEATRLFAEVQAANEVLSDPQERAWYDSHEAAILRGGDVGEDHFEGNVKVMTAEDVTAVIGKFNGRVKFDDSPDGFFGFLRDAFARLAKEEEVAGDWDGLEIPDYPSFGHKDDTYDDVVKSFYQGWAGFSTMKSFAWKDEYRLNEAPDRRIKRLMEKENKKLRDDGIREFNEAVRALVAFVRKRDPRYTPAVQTDAERQKALRDASAAQAARARAANAAKMDDVVPDWAKVREPDDEVEISDDESEEELFECVACNKTFKSEKQFEAHERSKKHQKAVYSLKKKMQKDNARFNLDEDIESSGIETPQNEEEEEELDMRNGKSVPKIETLNIDNEATSDKETDSEESDSTKPVRDSEETPEEASEGFEGEQDSDYAPRSKVKSRLNSKTTPNFSQQEATSPSAPIAPEFEDEEDTTKAAQRKLGKAAQKRAKRAAKAEEVDAEELKFKCARCNGAFPSRTQLFQHIKDLGHAAPVPAKEKGKKR